MHNLTEILISSESIEHNSFLNIDRDQIQLPNGNIHERIVVRHPGAAAILAITEDDKVVLVRQWRHAIGRDMLELPAGKLDAGETPESCAMRELGEETPYTAKRMEKIHTFFTAPGFCDEMMHIFRAIDIRANSTLSPDEDELVETELLTRDEVHQAIQSGDICDAKTLIALQTWLAEK